MPAQRRSESKPGPPCIRMMRFSDRRCRPKQAARRCRSFHLGLRSRCWPRQSRRWSRPLPCPPRHRRPRSILQNRRLHRRRRHSNCLRCLRRSSRRPRPMSRLRRRHSWQVARLSRFRSSRWSLPCRLACPPRPCRRRVPQLRCSVPFRCRSPCRCWCPSILRTRTPRKVPIETREMQS